MHEGVVVFMTTTALEASMGARLRARKLSVSPDPISIARAFERRGLGGVALLHSAAAPVGEALGPSYVTAAPDRHTSALDPLSDDEPPIGGGGLAQVPRWIGMVPYEQRRGLERPSWSAPDRRSRPLLSDASWSRYPAVVRIDPGRGEVLVIGADDASIERLSSALVDMAPDAAPLGVRVRDDDDPARHLARVARARELILAGDLYQVNVARRLVLELAEGDALGLYRRLIAQSPAAYGGYIETACGVSIVSTSPELLLAASVRPGGGGRFDRLASEPIKGTRARGSDAATDRASATLLEADPKERAELAMIVDVVLNDLSRVCEPASVRVARPPAVHTHRTLHHRVARVVGVARTEVSRRDVLEAMVPSGSVTGAPKVRAMEVIAELEAARRGLYTGGFGYVAHDGSLQLAMAIRTAVLEGGAGHYWTGGGIVAESDPERELEETRVKALALSRLVNAP